MRSHIGDFRQQALIDLGINEKERLILDQFRSYQQSATMKKRYRDGKTFFYIKYRKVMDDLPILNITDRTYRTYIHHLTQLGILEKYAENSTELYLHVELGDLIRTPSKVELTYMESPTRFVQDSENPSQITISTGLYSVYCRDLDDHVKNAIKKVSLPTFKNYIIDHITCQLGVQNPSLKGAFDHIDINISINYVIEIKAIHASLDALRNLSSRLFKALTFAIIHTLRQTQ